MNSQLGSTSLMCAGAAKSVQVAAHKNRTRRHFRFRLRTLLLAPIIVIAMLLIAFPKLVTGDFVEVTVVSIENNGRNVQIEFDVRISSGTGWGATLSSGPFGGLSTYSKSQGHRARIIRTWPKRETIFVNLQVRTGKLPDQNELTELLRIKQDRSYRVTPHHALEIVPDNCYFKISRGGRLGF